MIYLCTLFCLNVLGLFFRCFFKCSFFTSTWVNLSNNRIFSNMQLEVCFADFLVHHLTNLQVGAKKRCYFSFPAPDEL